MLTTVLTAGSLWAETLNFHLFRDASLNGTHLESGRYKLKLNDGEAEFYRDGRLVVTAKVEVRPLEKGRLANTTKIEGGELREIRLKREAITFIPEG